MAEQQLDNTTEEDSEQLIKIEEGEIVPDLNTSSTDQTEPSGNVNLKLSDPAKDAGFLFSKEQEKVAKDIEQRQVKPFVPNINQLLFEDAEIPENINKQTVDKAKLYVDSLSNKNNNLSPALRKNLFNSYKTLKQDLQSSELSAEQSVPKSRAFGVTVEGEVAPEYADKGFFGFFKGPERRLAENRSRLVKFGARTKISKRSPEAFSVLTEEFATGNTFDQFLNDTKDIISGGTTLQKIIRNYTSDYAEAFGKAMNDSKEGDEGVFDLASQYFKEKANQRRTEIELYMNGFQDNAILANSTDRLNTFIKNKYIEKNGEQAYKDNADKLTLQDQDARAIYNFASAELTFVENYFKDIGINVGFRVGLATVGKGLGQLLGTKSPVKFLLDQERKKQTFPKNADGINPYAAVSAVKFTEQQATQIQRDGFFKFLIRKLNFRKTRQTLKAQQGQYIIDDVAKNMDPKYQKALDDAYEKVRDATTAAAKDQALGELDIAENAFLKATTSGFNILKGNRYAMPIKQLQDVLGDELLPTAGQSFLYNALTSGEASPEQLERANLLQAVGYFAPAILSYPFKWIVAGGEAVIPTGSDLTFAIKKTLDGVGLTKAVGLKNMLDPDIMDVKLPNEFGVLKSPTVEQYRVGNVFKNLSVRQDDQTRAMVLKNSENLNRDIDAALSVVKNKPLVDIYKDKLRLSYAQISSISFYHGLGQSLMSKLTSRDILSTSGRFNTAVKAMREADELLVSHSMLLDDLKSAFIDQARNNKLSGEGSKAIQNILDLENNLNVAFAGVMQENKQQAALVQEEIGEMLKDPQHFLSLSPSELDDVLDSRLANVDLGVVSEARGIKYESPFFKQGIDEKTGVVEIGSVASSILKIQQVHVDAMTGLKNATELLSTKQGEIPNYNTVRKAVKSHYGIVDNFYRNISKRIYEPLDDFGTVEATELYRSLIDLHKNSSFEDLGIDDYLLTNFRPKSEFNKSARGKEFTAIMNRIADESLKKTFINKYGDAAEVYYRDFIESSKNIIGEAYGFPKNKATNEVKQPPAPIHYYDYFMAQGGIINDEPIAQVQIKMSDLVYLKRELVEKAMGFKKSDKSTIRQKAREYGDLSESVESIMKSKGSLLEITSNGRKTNAYAETQKMNILYGALVGKRKEKDSFLRQLEIINGRGYGADQKKAAFNKLTGKDLFDAMMKSDFDAKIEFMDSFRTTIEEAYGMPVLPKSLTKEISGDGATDDIGYFAGNRVLRDDIDYTATVPGEVYTYRDLFERSITYMLDPNTKVGQAGIEMADLSVANMFKYMSYHKYLKDNLGQLLQSNKIYTQSGELRDTLDVSKSFGGETFLSDPDGGGAYKEALQEALSFNTTSGTKYLGSVDKYMIDTEAEFAHVLKKSEKARQVVREQTKRIERAAKQNLASAEKEHTETAVLVEKTLLQLNINKPIDFIERYGIGAGLRNDVDGLDQEYMQRFVQDIAILKQESPNTSIETIKQLYANLLFNGLLESGGMVSVTVNRLPEQMMAGQSTQTQIRLLKEPAEVLQRMQHPNVRAYFNYLGVDDEHYDALEGVMRMIEREKGYRDKSMSPAVMRTDFTDANVLSRSFNWVRGMVGTEFLLADAGFRLLRDNEQQMFSFLLNDKENAKFMFAIASNANRPSPVEVSQFVARLEAFLIRNVLVSYDYDSDKKEQLGVIKDVINPSSEEFMNLKQATGK